MQVKVLPTNGKERPMAVATVTATIRFPVDVYEDLRPFIAQRELNTFVVDAVKEKLARVKKEGKK